MSEKNIPDWELPEIARYQPDNGVCTEDVQLSEIDGSGIYTPDIPDGTVLPEADKAASDYSTPSDKWQQELISLKETRETREQLTERFFGERQRLKAIAELAEKPGVKIITYIIVCIAVELLLFTGYIAMGVAVFMIFFVLKGIILRYSEASSRVSLTLELFGMAVLITVLSLLAERIVNSTA